VHGGSASIGCIAIGDAAIEELFCLSARATSREIVIAPSRAMDEPPTEPWIAQRYARVRAALAACPR
jgi:hypothetical protein